MIVGIWETKQRFTTNGEIWKPYSDKKDQNDGVIWISQVLYDALTDEARQELIPE